MSDETTSNGKASQDEKSPGLAKVCLIRREERKASFVNILVGIVISRRINQNCQKSIFIEKETRNKNSRSNQHKSNRKRNSIDHFPSFTLFFFFRKIKNCKLVVTNSKLNSHLSIPRSSMNLKKAHPTQNF